MGRKFIAALLAAASIMPGVAVAQDRGERGDRGAMRAERMQQRQAQQSPQAGAQRAERMQQRQARQAQQAPANVVPQRAERMQQRQTRQAQQSPAFAAQPRLREERRDDRAAFTAERQRDRQAFQSGQVTRDAFRADRSRDVQAYRQDRTQDRRDYAGDRRAQAQRGVNRSAADLNNQRWRDYDRNGPRANSVWSGGRNNVGINRGGGWNRDWRRDSRYDWNRFRGVNRNAFHLPRYYAPYGWNQGYRRFGVGAVLSASLFAQDYWIDDPWSYRLPDAGDDLRWVRYYNDAILVDVYTGETVDVIHDIFW